ncbi:MULTISPECIES: lysylphosphatidylglycerol synthase domain-containing protein [Asaia]|uniref:lysylphosphatidylglycerol synthase domain-containing protein n=1 Tax=Asaia TaxID=91914 RepID=UPI002FC2A419
MSGVMVPTTSERLTRPNLNLRQSLCNFLNRGRFVAVAATGAILLIAGGSLVARVLGPFVSGALMASMVFLFFAHCLRAVRLCVVSSHLLKIPARTTFFLHFATVPFAIIPPFKAGEVIRLLNLWLIAQSLSKVIVTVVLDRLFDAVMLLLLLSGLYLNGHALSWGGDAARTIQWMIVAVTLSAGICFLICPRAFTRLQNYVVVRHSGSRTLFALRLLDMVRIGTTNGERLLRSQGAILMMITVLIWGLELLATALISDIAIASYYHNAGVLLVSRTTQEWRAVIAQSIDPALAVSAAANIFVILLVWPFATWGYLVRLPKCGASAAQQRTKV